MPHGFAASGRPGSSADNAYYSSLPIHPSRPSLWRRKPHRAFLMVAALLVLFYSIAVIVMVAWMGDIGLRCVFSTEVKESIPEGYEWIGTRPRPGDTLRAIGEFPIANYVNYARAMRAIGQRVGQTVDVSWEGRDGEGIRTARARVVYRPLGTYIWSLIWFSQEMLIFAVGGLVFWKRPHDASARLFFWLCIVTVGAYMGGYHWTEIVVGAGADLSVRGVRGLRAGGQPPLLPGLPPAEPDLRGLSARGPGGDVRDPLGLSRRALGGDVRVAVAGAPRRGRACPGRVAPGPRPGAGLHRAGGRDLRALHPLPGDQLPLGADAGRAEPGPVDPAGLADRLGAHRLPPEADLVRPLDARPRQRGLADVRGLAPVHAGVRAEHHAVQADAGRGDHQPERGLLRPERDGGAALLGGAAAERHGHRRPVLRGAPDLARGDGGRGDGDRDPDRVGGGAGAVPEGDRPAVLPREVQVRPGDAEDAGWRSAAWSIGRRWAADCWRRRPRSCGWSGGRSTWRSRPGSRSGWWPATARPPTSRRSRPTTRWSSGSARCRRSGSRTRCRWRARPTRRPTR